MFDFFRSRDKAVRYFLGAILMLVALSMVITLIPGFGSQTRADDPVVAEIGKDAITTQQVRNELQSLVRGKQVPPEMLQMYAPQFIDEMITQRAVSYEAERLGLKVTDAELAAQIRAGLPQLFNNGQLVDKAVYERMLAEKGMTIPEFEDSIRKQILMGRLQNLVMEGIVVSPQEIQAQFEKANAKIKAAYLLFKPDTLKSSVTVTTDEVNKWYQANQQTYVEAEKRNLALLIADQEKIGATINLPEEQLRQAYNARRDQYKTPERVRARHILVKTTGAAPADQPKLRQKAEDLLKQLRAGGDFAALAKKNSDDTGSAEKGGELGWIVKGQMVKNFETAAFTQPLNKIGDLVTTEYGFHIVQVEEKQDAHVQSFDEVKVALAGELKKQQVFDRMQNSSEQARLALQKAPGNVEAIAKQFGLELVAVERAAPGQVLPQVGAVPDLDAALAGLKKGEVTPVFQAQGDKLVVAQVTDVIAAHVQPLADVETRVRETLAAQKAKGLATERATQAAAKMKAGEDPAKVAKDLGAELKTTTDFTINDTVEGIGGAAAFSPGFAQPVGAVIGPAPAAGDAMIAAKTVTKTPADPSLLPAQRESIMQDIKQRKAADRRELFYDSILASLIQSGKVKKHKDVINRLVSSYRPS